MAAVALYAYTRVSRVNANPKKASAEDGQSLEVQSRQLEGWAMMKGLTISATFVEKGVSGSVPIRERTAGAKLWAKLDRGDTVVASKLDRMFRDARDALNTVEELKAKGVALILLDLGTEPVSNGLSQMFLTIVAAFATMERHRIGERITAYKADAKSRGDYLGGKIPFGYALSPEGSLEPVEAEQAVVERARAARASGAPLRAIQADVEHWFGRKLSLATLSRITGDGAGPT